MDKHAARKNIQGHRRDQRHGEELIDKQLSGSEIWSQAARRHQIRLGTSETFDQGHMGQTSVRNRAASAGLPMLLARSHRSASVLRQACYSACERADADRALRLMENNDVADRQTRADTTNECEGE